MIKIDKKAADNAIDFFEKYLTHTKGEWAGKPFILAPWQKNKIIRPLFGTLNSDGTRQYRMAYVSTARKNGKSELASGVALKLLLADGEIGGEIYSVAGDRDQAAIVFNVAAQMVRNNPELYARCKIIDSQKRIVVYKTGSFYRVLSAEHYNKHGFNASGVIFDELHVQPNRLLWDVMTSSGGTRRQPLTFAITTAGFDENSICYEQYSYAKKIKRKLVDDPTFFNFICEVSENANWKDKKNWKKANPALGDFRKPKEMEDAFVKALEVPAYQNTFRRLYLNQWTEQNERWIDLDSWDATAGEVDLEDLEGKRCCAGLDLASNVDIAALVLVFPPDGNGIDKYKVLPFFFIPADNIEKRVRKDRVPYDVWIREGYIQATSGNVIDYGMIEKKFFELQKQYDLQDVAFDRWGATQISQRLDDEGFKMVAFGQGFASMAGPTKELMAMVLSKTIAHGGNPVLRWMANNMVVKQDPAGNLKPDKSKSGEKIDGMVALIMAIDRAIRHNLSVYDERGILTM